MKPPSAYHWGCFQFTFLLSVSFSFFVRHAGMRDIYVLGFLPRLCREPLLFFFLLEIDRTWPAAAAAAAAATTHRHPFASDVHMYVVQNYTTKEESLPLCAGKL